MRISILIMLTGLLVGQGDDRGNFFVWQSTGQGEGIEGSVTVKSRQDLSRIDFSIPAR